MWDEAQGDESELESTLKTQGLEATMNQAERMAVAGGYLDPQRTDGRVFFENDAPPDPLTTNRDRELTQPQYSIGAISANGEHFLDVMKTWGDDNYERLVIPQPTWDKARLAAETTADLHTSGNLQGAMYLVEQAGIEAGVIDPLRNDPRLFTQGPEDPFTTLRETEIDGELARYGVTWRESYEWAAFAPEEPDTDTVHPYWRMETLPVNDLDGESLGYALHMVVYPNIAHDAERIGSPKMAEDEPFRMLEMVHFETTEAADKFGKEFNSYLQPGLLEGPELAQEVAKLEGLSGAWKTLEGDDLTAYRNAELTLTRDPSDWHPYNPNAEREARIAAEGLYYDPIQQFVKLDEDPKIEPVSPDLDL
jgi:hypothetical protein